MEAVNNSSIVCVCVCSDECGYLINLPTEFSKNIISLLPLFTECDCLYCTWILACEENIRLSVGCDTYLRGTSSKEKNTLLFHGFSGLSPCWVSHIFSWSQWGWCSHEWYREQRFTDIVVKGEAWGKRGLRKNEVDICQAWPSVYFLQPSPPPNNAIV